MKLSILVSCGHSLFSSFFVNVRCAVNASLIVTVVTGLVGKFLTFSSCFRKVFKVDI